MFLDNWNLESSFKPSIKLIVIPSPLSVIISFFVHEIIKKEGMTGLLFRGLDTRILANGLNGMLFSVLWKVFMDN